MNLFYPRCWCFSPGSGCDKGVIRPSSPETEACRLNQPSGKRETRSSLKTSFRDLLLRPKQAANPPSDTLPCHPTRFLGDGRRLWRVYFGPFNIWFPIHPSMSYGQSLTTARKHYIAIVLRTFRSSQVGGHVMDAIWCLISERHSTDV